MNDEKQKQRILNDGLWKLIFDFSWSAVVAMALLGANNVLDGVFVGRLVGPEALAGISVVLPPLLVLIGFALLCGTGAGSLLSIAIGAGDKDIQKKLLGNMNTLMLMSALFLMCIGFAFSHRIVF
ncbi:MAG: MATE family efflux transporter, partial [Treponema socranskii subsp. buccale]